MNITIKKWGNYQGIILQKLDLSDLGFNVDDELKLDVEDGKIILSKAVELDDFSDLILEDLINNGYEGEELLNEFKRVKKNMPKAVKKFKRDVLNEYKSGDTVDYEELFDV